MESNVFSELLLGDKYLEVVTRTARTGAWVHMTACDAHGSHYIWGLASQNSFTQLIIIILQHVTIAKLEISFPPKKVLISFKIPAD